jgi:hypothetical protein
VTRNLVISLALLGAAAALAVVLAPPDARAPVTRAAILVVGAAGAWLLIRRTGAVTRSTAERFDLELQRPVATPSDVPSLRTIETTLRMATANAFGVEFMLKPLLRDLVEWRLARNRSIDLRTAPDLAREAMGEDLWRLLHVHDPNREHDAPGVTLDRLQASIERLESI